MAPLPSSSSSIQLLEINMISAQDLATVSKSMRTFAVAWLNPDRKLTTRVDQSGHKSPTWNEKFVFRVDNNFLDDENSTITVEIYESAWLRDVIIGSVTVLIADLVPAAIRSQKNSNSKMRYVALQVRRPSGRPKGILNVGVTLLDSTMRSMPLYSEVSASAVEFWDLMDVKEKVSGSSNSKILLHRSKSERTEREYHQSKPKPTGCNCNGSMLNGSSSMLNGSEIGNKGGGVGMGSICSDVGPSPSVVAAAIAKGLYPIPPHRNNYKDHECGSSILDDWTEQDDSVEGLKTKIERWRTELPPIYDRYQNNNNNYRHANHQLHHHHRQPITTELRKKKSGGGGGLFSCFIFGCEFSIACGGSNPRRKRFNVDKNHRNPSELTFEDDDIYV